MEGSVLRIKLPSQDDWPSIVSDTLPSASPTEFNFTRKATPFQPFDLNRK
jgi:hypothetical protein